MDSFSTGGRETSPPNPSLFHSSNHAFGFKCASAQRKAPRGPVAALANDISSVQKRNTMIIYNWLIPACFVLQQRLLDRLKSSHFLLRLNPLKLCLIFHILSPDFIYNKDRWYQGNMMSQRLLETKTFSGLSPMSLTCAPWTMIGSKSYSTEVFKILSRIYCFS